MNSPHKKAGAKKLLKPSECKKKHPRHNLYSEGEWEYCLYCTLKKKVSWSLIEYPKAYPSPLTHINGEAVYE